MQAQLAELDTDRCTFVYLIGPVEGCYKIGHSNDPESRAKTLSQGLDELLPVVHTIASTDGIYLERTLHAHFHECRVGGEWFRLSDQDIDLFKTLTRIDSAEDMPPGMVWVTTYLPMEPPPFWSKQNRKKVRPGRPKKLPDGVQRTISCILVNAEMATFDAARKALGMSQLEFTRAAVLHAARQIADGKAAPFAERN